jgi:hypothetical protein
MLYCHFLMIGVKEVNSAVAVIFARCHVKFGHENALSAGRGSQ